MSDFTKTELAFLERIVHERAHKEKAKQKFGKIPKKYSDIWQKIKDLQNKE